MHTISDSVHGYRKGLPTIADTLAPVLASDIRFDTSANDIDGQVGWLVRQRPGSGVSPTTCARAQQGRLWTMIYGATTATSATRSLAFGAHYTYQFRARDKGGRRSGWSSPFTFTPARYQESTSLAAYSSSWKPATISSASGNHTKYAKGSGAVSTFSFTGRAVSLVAPRSSSRGKADIRVDGVVVATVNLYRSSTTPGVTSGLGLGAVSFTW